MQKDYVLRIIEQFVAVLLSIIRARKAGNRDGAMQLIQATCEKYLKRDLATLMLSSPEQLAQMFTEGQQLDSDRCLIGAELLYETASLLTEKDQRSFALQTKALSLHLFELAAQADETLQSESYRARITHLRAEIEN